MVCDALINEITEKIDKATHWHKWGARTKFFYLRKKEDDSKRALVKDHIKWVLEQEYNTMEDPNKKETYRIYRGGHEGTAYRTNESSSFGDGAFSSVIFSPRHDMPFNVALGKGVLAYIDVDKKQYRTTQDYPVFIPPVFACAAVFGEGEYHHPRTRVYDEQGRIPGVYKENAAALDENIDDRWLITNNLNQLKELLNSIKVFDRSFLVQ
jgi:hypothetical protein